LLMLKCSNSKLVSKWKSFKLRLKSSSLRLMLKIKNIFWKKQRNLRNSKQLKSNSSHLKPKWSSSSCRWRTKSQS
jgi:hypothetical protein